MDWRKKVQKKGKGLRDGEQVLGALMTNPLGFTSGILGKEIGGIIGQMVAGRAGGNDLAKDHADASVGAPEGSLGARVPEGKRGVLAVTDQRWTFHKHSTLSGNPGDLLHEWTHGEVVGHLFEKSKMASTLVLVFSDGSQRALEIPMLGDVEEFLAAASGVGAPGPD